MANNIVVNTKEPVTYYGWDKYNTIEKTLHTWKEYASDSSYSWDVYESRTTYNHFYATCTTAMQPYTQSCLVQAHQWSGTANSPGNPYPARGSFVYGLYPEMKHYDSVKIVPDTQNPDLWLFDSGELRAFVATYMDIYDEAEEYGQVLEYVGAYPFYRAFRTRTSNGYNILTTHNNTGLFRQVSYNELEYGVKYLNGSIYGKKVTPNSTTKNFGKFLELGKHFLFVNGKGPDEVDAEDGLRYSYGYSSSFTNQYKPTLFRLNEDSYLEHNILYNVDEISFFHGAHGHNTSDSPYIISQLTFLDDGPYTDMQTVPYRKVQSIDNMESTMETKETGYITDTKLVVEYERYILREGLPDINKKVGTVASTNIDNWGRGCYYNPLLQQTYLANPAERVYNWTCEPVGRFVHTENIYSKFDVVEKGYCNAFRATDQNIEEWSMANNIYTIPSSRYSTSNVYINSTTLTFYKYPVNYNQVPILADDTENKLVVSVNEMETDPNHLYFPYIGDITNQSSFDKYIGKYVQDGYQYIALDGENDSTYFIMILPCTSVSYQSSYGFNIRSFALIRQEPKPSTAINNPAYGIHGKLHSISNTRLYDGQFVTNSQIPLLLPTSGSYENYWQNNDAYFPPQINPLVSLENSSYSTFTLNEEDVDETYYDEPNSQYLILTDKKHWYETEPEYRFKFGTIVPNYLSLPVVQKDPQTGYIQLPSSRSGKDYVAVAYETVVVEEGGQGAYLRDVSSFDRNAYPDDGGTGGYYYVYDSAYTDYYCGDNLIDIATSFVRDTYPDDGRYRGYWYKLNGATTTSEFNIGEQYLLGGVDYNHTMQTGDELKFGLIASAEINFSIKDGNILGPLLDGQKCSYFVKQESDTDWRKIGEFYIQDINYDTNTTCQIRAQDILYKLDEATSKFITDAYSQRLTYTFVDACQDCGMGAPLQNVDNPLPINFIWDATKISNQHSHREVISAIAEINNGYVYANTDGVVCFTTFRDNDTTLNSHRYAYFHKKPFNPKTYSQLQFDTTNPEDLYIINDGSGVYANKTYTVKDNCIVETLAVEDPDLLQEILESMYRTLALITYTPSYIDLLQDYGINLGDVLNVDGHTVIVIDKSMNQSGCKLNCYGK